jgi:hypothetical protein
LSVEHPTVAEAAESLGLLPPPGSGPRR